MARDNASPAFRNVGNAAGQAGQQTSRFGKLTNEAMSDVKSTLAGIGIGAVLLGAVNAASDLNETVNKTNVIFGDNADEVRAWSANSAQSFGLSQQAALEAASGFGNMMQQLGFTGDAALEASTSTVKLAADLGSFNNLETGDVLERIGAALRGEYDSLQALIPNINAARVEQEAMAATGKTTASALNAQEKAAATLAIVQRDGAAAADDFSETSDGLANSQKILTAEWEDAQAKLGQLIVGPMTGIVQLVTDALIPAFEGVVGVLSSVGGYLAGNVPLTLGLATALGVLAVGVETVVGVMLIWASTTDKVGAATATALTSFGAMGALLSSVAVAVGSFIAAMAPLAALGGLVYVIAEFVSASADVEERLKGAREASEDFSFALAEQNGEINQATRDAAALAVEAAGLTKVFEDANISSLTLTEGLAGNTEAFQKLLEAAKAADAEASLVGNSWGLLGVSMDVASGQATTNADALLALRDTSKEVGDAAEVTAGQLPLFGMALQDIGENAQEAAVQTEEAARRSEEAIQAWRDKLAGINDSFIEPLGVYKTLLDEKNAKERESAEATAAATDSAEDSWEDYVEKATVSLDEWAAQLDEQILAQENWRTNLVTIAQRGGEEIATIFAEMGVEGAAQTAQMATATEEDFQHMRDSLIRESQLAGSGATGALDRELQIMAAVGAAGASATVNGISTQLNIGADEVRRIASKYGIGLAEGINPVLASLGKPTINGQRMPGLSGGGYTGDGGKYEPKGVVHGGEYVEPMESVNYYGTGIFEALHQRRIPREALPGYAGGGFVSPEAVPKPPSVAPYRYMLGDPATATMDRAYGDTVDWLEENLVPPAAALSGPGKWSEMFAAVQRAFPSVQLHSGFRPGSITATGNLSYHALGRAIDITPDASIFNWLAGNYPGSRELIYSPMGGRQIWNGAPHFYSEPTRGDHWDHIHWAMANGGVINEPVIGRGLRTGQSYSFGERGPETVVPGVPMAVGSASASRSSAPVEVIVRTVDFSGALYLDSGEFMGKVQGVAEGVATEALALVNSRGRYNR